MSEYYAVIRSTDYLAHYGVKGMKWGVRKAIEKGNMKKLSKHYAKASKKLQKLNDRTDVQKQAELSNKYNKAAKVAGKVGLTGTSLAVAGTGTNHTLHYINSLHKIITNNKIDENEREIGRRADDYLQMQGYTNSQYNSGKISEAEWKRQSNDIEKWLNDDLAKSDQTYNSIKEEYNKGKNARKLGADIGKVVGYVGAGAGLAGLGTYAVTKGKAIAAKKRTTAKGHAKAVAKRDEFKREMENAFKGTPYEIKKEK